MPEETLAELGAVAQDAVAHLLGTESFRSAAHAVLDANAARSVGDLLAEAGVTTETLVAQLRPWILRAADDGLLEDLVRQRLTAFYETY
jgi:hypothetical protein